MAVGQMCGERASLGWRRAGSGSAAESDMEALGVRSGLQVEAFDSLPVYDVWVCFRQVILVQHQCCHLGSLCFCHFKRKQLKAKSSFARLVRVLGLSSNSHTVPNPSPMMVMCFLFNPNNPNKRHLLWIQNFGCLNVIF